MANRIVGQCRQADFAEIAHLAVTLEKPEMLDTSTLTNSQRFALRFVALAQRKKVPWKSLKLIKEVLFWGDDRDVSGIEIKFITDMSKLSKIKEFRELWGY